MSAGRPKYFSMFINLSKKNLTLVSTLALALVFVGSSCKKDEDKTYKDLLTAHDWQVSSLVVSGFGDVAEDCDRDDVASFHDDGEYHLAENVRCEETDPESYTGAWAINESASPQTLTLTYEVDSSNVTEVYDITELTDKTMVLTTETVLGTVTSTFIKK